MNDEGLTVRFDAARAFLAALGGDDGGDAVFTFQTFDDSEAKRRTLARTIAGTLDQVRDLLKERRVRLAISLCEEALRETEERVTV